MPQVNTNHKKLCLSQQRFVKIGIPLLVMLGTNTSKADYFDPAFLSDGNNTVEVSDLSRFENQDFQLPGTYRVDVFVNDSYVSTRDFSFYEITEKNQIKLAPCIDLTTLEQYGVQSAIYPELGKSQQNCIPFTDIIEGASYHFDFSKQKLAISFPQAALNNQARGYIPPEQWDKGINAMFLNYNFSGNNSSVNSNNYFLSLDTGLNLGAWQLRHSNSINYTHDNQDTKTRFNSLNTYVQRPLIGLKSQLVLGDSNSSSDVFDSLSFRGARLYSSDEMIPDSQQGYAPTIRGVAKTNARIVIQQNGYTVYQTYVSPGPFVLDDLYSTSTSGDYQVRIEETDGTIQQYIVPYSTLPILQREGRTKYDVIIGEYRSGNKSQSTPTFAQITAIHGLKNGLTVYTGAQVAEKYQAATVGLGSNLGDWGAVSVDATQAKSELADGSVHNGQSYRFLYAKSMLRSGTTFRLLGYRYSTRGFYTLNEVAYDSMQGYEYDTVTDGHQNKIPVVTNYYDLNKSKRGSFQANISHDFRDYGTLYISAHQQDYWGTNDKDRWIQAGYATNYKGVNYAVSYTKNQSRGLDKNDYLLSLNVSFPLSNLFGKSAKVPQIVDRAHGSLSTVYNAKGSDSYLATINGTLLEDNNLSYNFTQSYVANQGNAGSLSLAYRGTYGNLGAGFNYTPEQNQFNYSASGGILIHADGITFGQNVYDTTILVKAPGAKGVSLENHPGVKTDWRGYTFLPYATNYRNNRIALNPESYADNLEIKNNVQYAVPMKGAIVRATFKPTIGIRALVKFKHRDRNIPFGSAVTELETKGTSMTDDEGQAYITGLPLQGTLKVQWGTDATAQCLAHYSLEPLQQGQSVAQIELPCE